MINKLNKMGLDNDIKDSGLKNVIKGWITTLLIGIPCVIGLICPFEFGTLKVGYDPEWFMRLFFFLFAILGLSAPDRIPTIVLEIFDLVKTILGKKGDS